MKTTILSLFCLVLLLQGSYGQGSSYYWYNGNKVYLTISMDWLQVEVSEDFQKTSVNNLGVKTVTEQ